MISVEKRGDLDQKILDIEVNLTEMEDTARDLGDIVLDGRWWVWSAKLAGLKSFRSLRNRLVRASS